MADVATQQARGDQAGVIDRDGFPLRYSIEGSGPTALIPGSVAFFPNYFSEDLRSHLRLAFVDNRAHAPGPLDPDMDLGVFVEDMEHMRQELDLGKVVLIGHAAQAYPVLEYAKKYPENVTHVVLIAAAPSLGPADKAHSQQFWDELVDPERRRMLEANLEATPYEDLLELPPNERYHRVEQCFAPKIFFDPHFDSSDYITNPEINQPIRDRFWGEIFAEYDITDGLADLDRPVFLALGVLDLIFPPPSAWDRVRPFFKDLTLRVFPRSGHYPCHEEAELFDAELLAWLSDRST